MRDCTGPKIGGLREAQAKPRPRSREAAKAFFFVRSSYYVVCITRIGIETMMASAGDQLPPFIVL